MNTMAEFARQLAAEAEKRGLRIVIEPVRSPSEATQIVTNPAPETHETKVVSQPTEAISVPKIAESHYNNRKKEAVREASSWITVAQCARMLNCSTAAIYERIRQNRIEFQFDKHGCMTVSTKNLNGLPGWKEYHTAVPVECVETGKTYPSMAKAAYAMGMAGNAVRNAIRRNTTAGGFHFRIIET